MAISASSVSQKQVTELFDDSLWLLDVAIIYGSGTKEILILAEGIKNFAPGRGIAPASEIWLKAYSILLQIIVRHPIEHVVIFHRFMWTEPSV